MKKPFTKNIGEIIEEGAHDGSGSRKLLLSQVDDVSQQLEAVTKGFLEPGSVFDWHQHENVDEFWIVISGRGYIEYKDGTIFQYKKDDVIYNPANLGHKIVAEGDKTSEYYFVRINA